MEEQIFMLRGKEVHKIRDSQIQQRNVMQEMRQKFKFSTEPENKEEFKLTLQYRHLVREMQQRFELSREQEKEKVKMKEQIICTNTFGNYKNVLCGILGNAIATEIKSEPCIQIPIPLESVSVFASIAHCIAKVQVIQIFHNTENLPLNGVYYFPIDSTGGVTHFHAQVDDRKFSGEIKSQEKTQDLLTSDSGMTFKIDENQPDIFKVEIGLLNPGAKARIVIHYATELKIEFGRGRGGTGAFRFFVPMTIAPRYVFPSDQQSSSEQNLMTFSEFCPAPISIKVIVYTNSAVRHISSPTHKFHILEQGFMPKKKDWSKSIVQLECMTTEMDRDFVLLIRPFKLQLPRVVYETMKAGNGLESVALLAHFIPDLDKGVQKSEFIFLVDRSGSMMGESIKLAKKALLVKMLFLHLMPENCYFNIVGFGSSHIFLFENGSVKQDQESMDAALRHIESMQADLGGTEIMKPLRAIMIQKPTLKDTYVSNTEDIVAFVKLKADSTRVFTLGIGESVSHYLVDEMANVGGGVSAFVTHSESEPLKLEAVAANLFKTVLQPSLTEVKAEWEIAKERTGKEYFRQVPYDVPPILDGSQLILMGHFENDAIPSGVMLSANSPSGQYHNFLQFELSKEYELGTDCLLHQLAAIKMIRELELEDVLAESPRRKTHIKSQIIHLSHQFGIISKYTSFVAVESNNDRVAEIKQYLGVQTRHAPPQLIHSHRDIVAAPNLLERQHEKLSPDVLPYESPLSRFEGLCRFNTHSTRAEELQNRMVVLNCKRTEDGDGFRNREFNFDSLSVLQASDGSFTLNCGLSNAIGLNIRVLEQDATKYGYSSTEWATAIAIICLNNGMRSQQHPRLLVEYKAMRWLLKHQGEVNIKKILELAQARVTQ